MFDNVFAKSLFRAVLALTFLASTLPAHARDRDDKCHRQIQKAEQNLDNAVRKHGERSRQAEKRRQQLEQARQRCHMEDHDHDHDRH
jgi:hypothetical protein